MSDSNSSVEVVQEEMVKKQSNNNKRKHPEAKRQIRDERVLTEAFRCLSTEKKVNILMAGLKSAGKATIIRQLGNRNIEKICYIALDIETVVYKNIYINVAQHKTRSKFFRDTNGLIFVVDITDRDRVIKARNELHKMLNEDSLKDVVVLVFANKQDLPNAMTSAEITENFGHSFYSSLRQLHCRVQMTCATSGEGLYEGLEWLSQTIRVEKALKWLRKHNVAKSNMVIAELERNLNRQAAELELLKMATREETKKLDRCSRLFNLQAYRLMELMKRRDRKVLMEADKIERLSMKRKRAQRAARSYLKTRKNIGV